MNLRILNFFSFSLFLFVFAQRLLFASQKPDTENSFDSHSFWEYVKGEAEQNQVHLGMLSYHITFAEDGFKHNWKHKYLALIYEGFFLGTLVNSRYKRSYLAGVTRSYFQRQFLPGTKLSLGYSLGAITGYDKKSFDFAEKTPALPFFSLNASVHHKKVGVFWGWCAFVFYTTLSIKI